MNFPNGDVGGNSIHISTPFKKSVADKVSNFHSLWDSVMGEHIDVARPLTSAKEDSFHRFFERLTKKYPKESFDLNNLDIKKWSTGT